MTHSLTNSLTNYLTNSLTNSLTIFFTYNLLTIASFRIGVPSILFIYNIVTLNSFGHNCQSYLQIQSRVVPNSIAFYLSEEFLTNSEVINCLFELDFHLDETKNVFFLLEIQNLIFKPNCKNVAVLQCGLTAIFICCTLKKLCS